MAFMFPVCYMVGKPKIEWGTIKEIYPLSLVGVMNTVSGLIGELAEYLFMIFGVPEPWC